MSVPCCAAGPSQPPESPCWSRPAAVTSLELSEATACAVVETWRDGRIREEKKNKEKYLTYLGSRKCSFFYVKL